LFIVSGCLSVSGMICLVRIFGVSWVIVSPVIMNLDLKRL
jgi:hypothetical protein